MPRHERLDFKDAIHYALVRGRDGSAIFFDADILRRFPEAPRQYAAHVQRFELLLADACTVYGAVLHAYCVEPNSGIMILQRAGAPLHALMRRLCGRYSRYLRAIGCFGGSGVFGARYDSKVVAPEYLPHVVRHAHRSPVLAGLCRQAVDYPFSSARAYAGELAPIPVAMIDSRNALEPTRLSGPRGYREFMNEDETPYVVNLLSYGSPLDSRVVGDKAFVQKARHRAAHPVVSPTREQLIAGVARLLNKTPADVFSATHVGALGRSLVAWYGVRSGAATLTLVGRWFSVSAATLGQGIRRHRDITPELFDRAVMPALEGGIDDDDCSPSR
jgi:putative transposase